MFHVFSSISERYVSKGKESNKAQAPFDLSKRQICQKYNKAKETEPKFSVVEFIFFVHEFFRTGRG
jgi:hypothetical protein